MTTPAKVRSAAFFCFFLLAAVPVAQAQTGQITGTVVDSSSGATLPGVNIAVVGTQQGTSTGPQGNFTIGELEPGTYELSASFVGYVTETVSGVEVQAGDSTQVDITMQQESVEMEEVVVVGYGEQERRDLTGSISSVSGAEVSEVPTPSLAQALQGKAAGVQVTPSSGAPGSDAVIRIRGVGTLNNANPLYVVDGMLTDDISFLSPNNIESIEVLKDASATAIYGSRGANGVIIITTQRGNRGDATTFSADVYYGQQQVADPIDLVGPQQYALLANELAANEGLPQPFANPEQITGGTDWQDVVFRTAPLESYQLGARGGTERITYNFTGGLVREQGILRGSNQDEASVRLNSTYDLNDAIQLGQNLAFTYRDGVNEPGGLVSDAYSADPTIRPRDQEGNFNDASVRASTGNPAATIFYDRNEYAGSRLVGNLYVEADVLRYFTLKSSFGVDLDYQESRDFTPQFFVSPTQQTDRSSLSINQQEEESWLWENTLTYEQTYEQHSFDVLTGITAQEFRFEDIGGSRTNIVGESENLWYLNAGDQEGQSNSNSAYNWSLLSYLFRVNYSFLDRYLLTATMRADGSSRFGQENQYGYFPSVALGWRLSDEPFMQDLEFLSNLKLRGSWGQVGNDKIGAYPSTAVIEGNLSAVFGQEESLSFGATQTALANPGVRWEETEQIDIGLEAGLFEDRFTATADYYRRLTNGILVEVPIPAYVGVASPPTVNAAEVLNSGFELSLNFDGAVGGLQYGVGVNGSTVHNEVQALGQGQEEIFAGGLVNQISSTTRTVPGRPIGSFYGYQVAGIFQNEQQIEQLPTRGGEVPGDLRYADTNDDGQITTSDRVFLGSPIPDYTFGANFDLQYKGFDLSASLTGQYGNEIFNAKRAVRFGIDNFHEDYLDHWTGEGTSTTQPRLTNSGHNYLASDRFIEDGSYLKLQNLQFGYSLPSGLLGNWGIQQVRAYVGGTNLFTLTGYSGYSPEFATGNVLAENIDDGIYPVPRTITVGLNLSL